MLVDDELKFDLYWLESFFGFVLEEVEKVFFWGYCGILSLFLVNICFDELDYWMEGKIKEFYYLLKSDVIWNIFEGEVE